MRVLALHGRANPQVGLRLYSDHRYGEKIERSAEALRASHGPISFPPGQTPAQRRPGDRADKSAGRGVFIRQVTSFLEVGYFCLGLRTSLVTGMCRSSLPRLWG